MGSIVEQIKAELGDLLENAGFRLTDEAYDDAQHFGNAVVTFCSGQWCIRIVRDRGQFFLWFRDREGRSKWRKLGYLLAAYKGCDSLPEDFSASDANQLADYLRHHLETLGEITRNRFSYSEPLEDFLNEMGNQQREAAADRVFGGHQPFGISSNPV